MCLKNNHFQALFRYMKTNFQAQREICLKLLEFMPENCIIKEPERYIFTILFRRLNYAVTKCLKPCFECLKNSFIWYLPYVWCSGTFQALPEMIQAQTKIFQAVFRFF